MFSETIFRIITQICDQGMGEFYRQQHAESFLQTVLISRSIYEKSYHKVMCWH